MFALYSYNTPKSEMQGINEKNVDFFEFCSNRTGWAVWYAPPRSARRPHCRLPAFSLHSPPCVIHFSCCTFPHTRCYLLVSKAMQRPTTLRYALVLTSLRNHIMTLENVMKIVYYFLGSIMLIRQLFTKKDK